jgi:hypothetical protein
MNEYFLIILITREQKKIFMLKNHVFNTRMQTIQWKLKPLFLAKGLILDITPILFALR